MKIKCPNSIEVAWKKAMEEVIIARISELVIDCICTNVIIIILIASVNCTSFCQLFTLGVP